MLRLIRRHSAGKREIEDLKLKIKDYEEQQELRRGWIERKMDFRWRLHDEIEEIETLIKKKKSRIDYIRHDQEGTRFAMHCLLNCVHVYYLTSCRPSSIHRMLDPVKVEKYNKYRVLPVMRVSKRLSCKPIKSYVQ